MKNKDFRNSIGCSLVILLLGVLIICSPILKVTNIEFLYRIFLGVYGIIQLGQFLILYKKKDYTNFFAFAISFGLLIASFMWDLTESPKTLAFSLLVWIAVIALVKLKKADYYILNSCTVTHKSDTETLYLLRNAKHINPTVKTVLTGCMAQVDKEELEKMALVAEPIKKFTKTVT